MKNNRLKARGTQNNMASRRRVLVCTAAPILWPVSAAETGYMSLAAILAYCNLLRLAQSSPIWPDRSCSASRYPYCLDTDAARSFRQ